MRKDTHLPIGRFTIVAIVFVSAWFESRVTLAQSATTKIPTPSIACSSEALTARAPAGTTIVEVTQMPATKDVPEYCQVDSQVTTPDNAVNIRLRLPVTWNGKFYFHGTGGYAGSVEPTPPSLTGINNMLPGLVRGYAVASTDTGHQGAASTDASWALNNRAKEIDYGYRGVHAATVAAKALTEGYYSNAPRLSYFVGCSNGGRQALMEAQRYPQDFDGIIAGAPSLGNARISRVLAYKVLLARPETYIPAAKLDVISRSVLAACDSRDGLADGLVSEPNKCAFKPETLLCASEDGPNCLTKTQIESLKELYSGFSTQDGKVKADGYPVGHEAGPTGWQSWIVGTTPPGRQPDGTLTFTGGAPSGFSFQDGFLRYLAFEQDDPNFDWRHFNLERDAAKLDFMTGIVSPDNPDLRSFRARGGKLIMFHGWADPALSAYSTIGYYDQVVRTMGGKAETDGFLRLFLAPGMTHCSGGPGPNMFVAEAIAALEAWVEQGKAPETIQASHGNTAGAIDRTRPLCVWPLVAEYKGSGSIDEAANFVCRNP